MTNTIGPPYSLIYPFTFGDVACARLTSDTAFSPIVDLYRVVAGDSRAIDRVLLHWT
ncbi:hypothetical protein [Pandoraea captiosa]|uniref:hypothetical protein n=1 Tax=Pandoraea captiosa TaxID=2508302 RepID=UPI0015835992|nr:hypothetical protein [Pandoraea captiosa]